MATVMDIATLVEIVEEAGASLASRARSGCTDGQARSMTSSSVAFVVPQSTGEQSPAGRRLAGLGAGAPPMRVADSLADSVRRVRATTGFSMRAAYADLARALPARHSIECPSRG
jgi:type IV secretory pathway TrbL component